MMLLFVGSNRNYFEYHKNASRPNWRFDSSDKSRSILMLRLFYTTGCWKTGILLSIRAACLLSDPVSSPLSESSGAFLKKRFFAAEHAFMFLRFFIPRGMSCLCRHYEQTSLSTLCFLQMERKSCLAGFFPHISTSKEELCSFFCSFHEKKFLVIKKIFGYLW